MYGISNDQSTFEIHFTNHKRDTELTIYYNDVNKVRVLFKFKLV